MAHFKECSPLVTTPLTDIALLGKEGRESLSAPSAFPLVHLRNCPNLVILTDEAWPRLTTLDSKAEKTTTLHWVWDMVIPSCSLLLTWPNGLKPTSMCFLELGLQLIEKRTILCLLFRIPLRPPTNKGLLSLSVSALSLGRKTKRLDSKLLTNVRRMMSKAIILTSPCSNLLSSNSSVTLLIMVRVLVWPRWDPFPLQQLLTVITSIPDLTPLGDGKATSPPLQHLEPSKVTRSLRPSWQRYNRHPEGTDSVR